MEGGQDPFGCLLVSRGRIERCWTLKAPSSRAILGGRCGGSPPSASGRGRRSSGPSGHGHLGGRLGAWWCTPITSEPRASCGRSRRQRRSWLPREPRALRALCRVIEARVDSVARRPPRGGLTVAARGLNPLSGCWPSGRPTGSGTASGCVGAGRGARCSASLKLVPGPLQERCPHRQLNGSSRPVEASRSPGGLRIARRCDGTASR